MLHKQTSELSKNLALISLRSTDNEGRCDEANRAAMILESHTDCDCIVSIRVNSNGDD